MTQKNRRLRNVRNGILSVLTALAGCAGIFCLLPRKLSYAAIFAVLAAAFLALGGSAMAALQKEKRRSPVCLALTVSLLAFGACMMTTLPIQVRRPGRWIEIEPIAHEGAVLDGEVYWVDARLNGKQIALRDLNIQYGADSGWDYIAEYDDYKLTQANLRDPQESRLFLDVGCADRLTLIFTQNAYGAGARIRLDSDTEEVISLYTQEDEQTCSLEIPAGEYGRIWRFVIAIGVAAGGWGLALLLLEALWDRHAGKADRVLDEQGRMRLQKGWLAACAVMSAAFALSWVVGGGWGAFPSRDVALPSAGGWGIFVVMAVSGTVMLYGGIPFIQALIRRKEHARSVVFRKREKALIFLALALVWIPTYLCTFPGLVSPDSVDSLHQVWGDYRFNNHHPILFTLYLKVWINLCSFFGFSNTIGIGMAALVQMLAVALACTGAVAALNRLTGKRAAPLLLTLFYALYPLFPVYAVTLWKDIYFGVAMTAFALQCLDMARSKKDAVNGRRVWGYCLSGVWVCFARNNGLYIFAATTLMMTVFLAGNSRKKMLAAYVSLALVGLIQGPGYQALRILKSSFAESVSIPMQQIGYAATHEEITAEEKAAIEEFIPVDVLDEVYVPWTSDKIKFNEHFSSAAINNDHAGFFKLWLSMLKKYPESYVKGFLGVTDGFWNVRRAIGASPAKTVNEYESEELPCESVDLIEKVTGYSAYENWFASGKCANALAKFGIPISGTVFLTLLACLLAIYRKNYRQLLGFAPCLFLWGTLMIATPIAYEHRYVFALYILAPFMVLYAALSRSEAELKG